MTTDRTQLANAVRFLAIDAIQKANSGHPGMPMGMADIAEVLWNDFLRHNPRNPKWPNRDRFILSNGHGSMLQYALLHLSGYDVSLDDLKSFRQLHSKTPGHPEINETPGVETTTGPLGQGLANAVGMALAQKILAATFNQESFDLFDHYVYVFVGDGCLMEGISHEVCTLAGTWGLNKLIVFWDDNNISIDGNVKDWFSEDVPKRFESYHWHVIAGVDGHDPKQIKNAILQAQQTQKPTLICCKTTIGFGSPNKANTSGIHGSPLGDTEIQKTREQLHWDYKPFEVPEIIYDTFNAVEKGKKLEEEWNILLQAYEKKYPKLAKELKRRLSRTLPEDFEKSFNHYIKTCVKESENLATRKISQLNLNELGVLLPELLGGSADLSGSNLTKFKDYILFTKETPKANYISYGVREFGMSAIMNGIALYGGFIPYGGTFLTFYSYATNAVRMAAIMKQQVIFVYTHDSIGVGEDGPTHQPIEQMVALRTTPNISVWRPADFLETAIAWEYSIKRSDGPTALLFSRQDLPSLRHTEDDIEAIKRGGYTIFDCEGTPNSIIIATGSEVPLAIEAAKVLNDQNIKVRVVSMPSTDVFLKQDDAYRELILPKEVTSKIAVETGSSTSWCSFVGDQGAIIGIDEFGLSAPLNDLQQYFGFTVDHIVTTVKENLQK